MSQGNPLNNLANSGYEQSGPVNFGEEALADNHVLSMMPTGGYQTATSAAGSAPSAANAAQTRAQEEQAISQAQAAASGMGPNAGAAQLASATGQNIKNAAALSAAAAASGAGGAGAARYNAANAAGTAGQAAGNEAAQLGVASQQAGAQNLAALTGQVGGQDISQQGLGLTQEQLALQNQQFNAGAQNTESQFGAQEQAGQAQLANEMNQGQFAQEYGLEQSQNAAVAGVEGQHEQNQQSMINAGIGGVTGGLSSGLTLLAKGAVVKGPHEVEAGEAGLEAEVPVPPGTAPRGKAAKVTPHFAEGGMVGIGGITPTAGPPDFSDRIKHLQNFTAQTLGNLRGATPQPSQPASFSPIPSTARGLNQPPPAQGGGGLASGVDTTQLAPMAGTEPVSGPPAAHGRLLTKPTILEAGENGPEAFIPVKQDGSADMARAKDPGVRKLIADHPAYRHPLSAGAEDDMGDHLAALKAQVAKLEQLHKSTSRRAA